MASKPPSPLAPRPSSLSLEPLEPRVLLDASAFDASPALFAANLGQWQDPSVRYVFQGAASAVAHTDAGVLFQISQRAEAGIQRSAFSVAFVGAEAVAPVGLDPSEALYNYYLGDPATWRSGVPTFQTVAYQGLWAGIDLLTWGRRDGLKYEFHLAPGADPAQVRLRYSGVEGLRLDDGGALHIATPLGEVVDSAPFIYQDVGGHRTQVAGAFALLDADTVSFAVTGPYDPRAELVIDPTLAWSSYLGGDSDDVGMGIAVDASGNAFLTGTTATLEPEFPTTGGFDTTLGGTSDAFITKVSAAGSLLWSTYLGGSGAEAGYGIAVHHAAGSVFVTGKTTSSNFPTTGGFDTTLGGTQDAFVTKVSGAGALLWSSYLGGSASDAGSGIAVDGSGDAFIAGYTESSNFPTTGGFDTALGGTSDGFVAKVGGAGGLLWASYLGGSATDAANGIGVDGSGNALIAGSTTSGDFPTAGGFDTTLGGLKDAFVAKVSGAGGFAWASYLGGSGTDDGYAIAVVGSSGEAFVAGETASTDFPTSGGFQTAYGGGTGDAFVAKIGGGGTFSWASYLGGVGYDYADGVAVDGAGDAFVTGATASAGLSTPDAFQTSYGGGASDAFVTKVSGAGSRVWSSYLGGSADDVGWGIAADASGNPFVTGYTMSANFPTPGGFDTSQGGYADVFVTKVNVASANNPPTLTTVSTLAGGTEDQDYTITYVALAGAADEADADGDPLSFRVEAVSSGTLTKGGVPVTPGTTLLSAGESLVWHPAADANGTLQAFTVKAWDGQAASATAVPVNVAVAPANDAPTLTTVNALAGGTEDQDYTITYAALKSAADEADIDGDTLSFRIEAVSSGTLTKGGVPVTPGTTLLSAGESLVWHPAADANGTLQAFTVRAWDGQAASPTAVPVSVQVAAVNDAPTLTTVNTLAGGTEDQDYAITYAALAGAADEADADGDPLSFRIEAVSSGTLTKGGVPVTPGTTLLSAGESLVWRPAADANGTLQAFTVKAWDGQAASPTAVPVSVQVAAVNDAPTLTTVNALAGGTEDQDYTITYAALAGAADEADADGDPLSFRIEAVSSGTLTKGGVPVTPGTTLLSAGESLVWHPAADANGTLQAFTVKAWDGQAASATAVPVNVAVAPAN
ncbi:MAG: LEPR-XLL domain-containing protein, partial [Planctomycetes bacterium]|nr:LEPR-XLL domain-containing protein [Planctomycetota bacterium]